MSEATIYLVRHAIAEERGDRWPDDDLRPLTEEGIEKFSAAARGFVQFETPPDRILTSPLVRARQTAELLAAAIKPHPPVVELEEMSPGHSPAAVLTQVRKLGDWERLALVGHEPDLGYLAAHLVSANHPLPFKKGGMCRIDIVWGRPLQGTMVWFLPPKALRQLAG
jgi:phosphohistidine phosphatase